MQTHRVENHTSRKTKGPGLLTTVSHLIRDPEDVLTQYFRVSKRYPFRLAESK